MPATARLRSVPPVSENYLDGLGWFFGRSPSMRNLHQLIVQLGKGRQSVLISGEVGTGKSLIARALHSMSSTGGNFVTFDISSLPTGHMEKALQQAIDEASAKGCGTLYLLGIDLLSLPAQKLLLEKCRTLRGEGCPRLISCCRQRMEELVEDARFLEPLYNELNSVVVLVPPLRERADDIPSIARYLAALHTRSRREVRLSDEAEEFVKTYAWPGNLRELLNAMQHAVSKTRGSVVDVDLIRQHITASAQNTAILSLPDAAEICLKQYFASLQGMAPPPNLYQRIITEVERPLIELVLRHARGNQLRAADILGLNRNTLRKKIRELNIDIKDDSRKA